MLRTERLDIPSTIDFETSTDVRRALAILATLEEYPATDNKYLTRVAGTIGESIPFATFDDSETVQAIAELTLDPNKPHAWLERIAVHPGLRHAEGHPGKGIGSHALTHVMDYSRDHGKVGIGLRALPNAIPSYLHHGFEPTMPNANFNTDIRMYRDL